MADLVSLETAKLHLHITGTAHDADITQKLAAAQEAILDYLEDAADDTWTETTVPERVVAAILFYLAHLFQHRGDDMHEAGVPDKEVWDAIGRLLVRLRLPALGTEVSSVA